jgi:hypothetical protein
MGFGRNEDLSRSTLIALTVAAIAAGGAVWKISSYQTEQERLGKLRAVCSQVYTPACDEIEGQ